MCCIEMENNEYTKQCEKIEWDTRTREELLNECEWMSYKGMKQIKKRSKGAMN